MLSWLDDETHNVFSLFVMHSSYSGVNIRDHSFREFWRRQTRVENAEERLVPISR